MHWTYAYLFLFKDEIVFDSDEDKIEDMEIDINAVVCEALVSTI